jgi:hypothetical protein
MILAIGASYQSDAPFSGQNELPGHKKFKPYEAWLARISSRSGERHASSQNTLIDVECAGESAV